MTDEHSRQGIPSWDHPVSPDGPRGPALLLFDVNETLSDMTPIGRRFEDVGAPAHLASTWFAGLLRDGFALTVSGASGSFASIAAEALRVSPHGQPLNRGTEDAVQHVMDGFAELAAHSDVPAGMRALSGLGIRLATLSNGSASVAEVLRPAPGCAVSSRRFSRWKMPVPGNPRWARTPMLSIGATWTPWTRCSSLCTRGTSTAPRARDSAPRGSTEAVVITRGTSVLPT